MQVHAAKRCTIALIGAKEQTSLQAPPGLRGPCVSPPRDGNASVWGREETSPDYPVAVEGPALFVFIRTRVPACKPSPDDK